MGEKKQVSSTKPQLIFFAFCDMSYFWLQHIWPKSSGTGTPGFCILDLSLFLPHPQLSHSRDRQANSSQINQEIAKTITPWYHCATMPTLVDSYFELQTETN
jgi:hypothetical protein